MTEGDILLSIATIVAIVVGPVLAVVVTRWVDEARAGKARKMEIFRTLMRTRKTPIQFDHVGALNLVEVEFIGHQNVVTAWKEYLGNLGEDLPPIEDKGRFETAVRRRDSLLTKLLSEIAKILKLKVEQIDILEGNYVPQGWHDDALEESLVRRQLLNVLSGRAPIIVQPQNPNQGSSPYPPPPPVEPPKA